MSLGDEDMDEEPDAQVKQHLLVYVVGEVCAHLVTGEVPGKARAGESPSTEWSHVLSAPQGMPRLSLEGRDVYLKVKEKKTEVPMWEELRWQRETEAPSFNVSTDLSQIDKQLGLTSC